VVKVIFERLLVTHLVTKFSALIMETKMSTTWDAKM